MWISEKDIKLSDEERTYLIRKGYKIDRGHIVVEEDGGIEIQYLLSWSGRLA